MLRVRVGWVLSVLNKGYNNFTLGSLFQQQFWKSCFFLRPIKLIFTLRNCTILTTLLYSFVPWFLILHLSLSLLLYLFNSAKLTNDIMSKVVVTWLLFFFKVRLHYVE